MPARLQPGRDRRPRYAAQHGATRIADGDGDAVRAAALGAGGDGAADEPVLLELLRAAVGGVDQRVDGVGDLAGRVVLVQLPLDALLAQLTVELDGGHVREPQVLLLPAVVLPRHLQVQLDLGLVLGLVHEEVDLEGVEGQQVLAVTIDHSHQLLGTELR